MSDVVFTSSYGPVLGLGNPKNPSSNAALGKICEHGSAHGVNIAAYGKCHVDYLVRCSTPNEKNSGVISHQALTKFIISEMSITDFERN